MEVKKTLRDSPLEAIVIGAGPAGLTAAYQLAKDKRSVRVLEQDPVYVGGISRTINYKGFLFDIGGHRFFSKSKAIVDLWNEILPQDFIERQRLSRIYYRGKFFSYPLKTFEAFSKLGPVESLACVLSYGKAQATPIKEPKTFHEWVHNHFGERLFSIFFKSYTEKVWGMSCDEISADWAAQRIKGLGLGAAVIDGVYRSLGRSAKAEGTVKTLIESFHYPRRGPGMMWEACARKIIENGGHVHLDHKVETLHWDATSRLWVVDVLKGNGARETFTARHIVSSAPVRDLVPSIRPTPISALHAGQLRYRDFLTVVLIGKACVHFDDNWIYIHDPSVKVARVQNFRSWSPELIPDETSTSLGLEYFCFESDGLWNSDDQSLIRLAKKEIGNIGLMRPEDVTDACVVRQPKAYPVYDDAYAENIEEVRRDLAANYPTLHLVGRNGMHKYNNQDHSMMTGLLTALNIRIGETVYDVWQLNEDARYYEAGASGIEDTLTSERLVPRKITERASAPITDSQES